MNVLNNPRVTTFGSDGYSVAHDSGPIRVLPNDVLGWGLYYGPNLNLVPASNGFAIGFPDAESAVEAALDVAVVRS